jgi:molybdopterin-guanine dinucleotide biosynthesis protein A
LLAHVVERLRPQVAEIVLNANDDPGRFAAFGLPLVADRLAGQMGPLAGIHAGLAWAWANRPEHSFVITVAADTPFFPADLVSRFCAATSITNPKLVVARVESGVASGVLAMAGVAGATSRRVARRRRWRVPSRGVRGEGGRSLLQHQPA